MLIMGTVRRLFTVVVVIAAIFIVVYVWQNKLGPNRPGLPGPRIITINPGSNIP